MILKLKTYNKRCLNNIKIEGKRFESFTFPHFSHLMSGGGVPLILHSNVAESPSQHLISRNSVSILGMILRLLKKTIQWNTTFILVVQFIYTHPIFLLSTAVTEAFGSENFNIVFSYR